MFSVQCYGIKTNKYSEICSKRQHKGGGKVVFKYRVKSVLRDNTREGEKVVFKYRGCLIKTNKYSEICSKRQNKGGGKSGL